MSLWVFPYSLMMGLASYTNLTLVYFKIFHLNFEKLKWKVLKDTRVKLNLNVRSHTPPYLNEGIVALY